MAEGSVSEPVTLFQQDPDGVTYRIPALLYIEDPPVFLAFAEKRSSPRDQDAMYLVMRRGVEDHGTLQWESLAAVPNAKLPDHRTMNPCPLYDRHTRTVFLFFCCVRANRTEMAQILTGKNAARVCYVASADHGRSWGSLVDVTEEVLAGDLKNCATVAVGPGHGVQSPSSGRLTVPAYLYYIHARICGVPVPWKTKPHSFVFYSDDHGKSWRRGSTVWQQPTGECEVAEVTRAAGPGVLYCSARTDKHYRVEALASDPGGGGGFDSSHFCQDLCEPPHGCQGSVVSYQPLEARQDESDGHTYHDDPNGHAYQNDPNGHTYQDDPIENACQDDRNGLAYHDDPNGHNNQDYPIGNARQDDPNGHVYHDDTNGHTYQTDPNGNACQDDPNGHTYHDHPNGHTYQDDPIRNAHQDDPNGHVYHDDPNGHTYQDDPIRNAHQDDPNGHVYHDDLNGHTYQDDPIGNAHQDDSNGHAYQNDPDARARLGNRAPSWLLYSHPTSRHKRVDLGIYLNRTPLAPAGWSRPWIINRGPSGYSDLAVCQGARAIGCLFECGAGACERIAFRRLTAGELMKNLARPQSGE
ncbi:sialidase-3 [Mantella aurantiaca]